MEVDEMSCTTEEECDCDWEEVHAVGNSKGEGKGKNKGNGKGTAKGTGRCHTGNSWSQDDAEFFPYKCHNWGKRTHRPNGPRKGPWARKNGRLRSGR